MGINRYMIPAEQKVFQSYVPQYVPLPIDELDKALTKVGDDLDKSTEGIVKMDEEEWNALEPDQKLGNDARIALNADIDEATSLTLADVIEPGSFSKAKKHITNMTRKWSKRIGKGGDLNSLNNNYDVRQKFKEKLEKTVKSADTRKKMLAHYDSQYAKQLGIGDKNASGSYQEYGTTDLAGDVDIYDKYTPLADKMKPVMEENWQPDEGFWEVVSPFLKKGRGAEYWQQMWAKKKGKFNTLKASFIEEVMSNAITADKETMDHVYQQAIAGTYYDEEAQNGKTYIESRKRGDDEVEARTKEILKGYTSSLGLLFQRGDKMKDEQISIQNMPAKGGKGKGGKKDPEDKSIPITVTENAIQAHNKYLNMGEEKISNDDDLEDVLRSSRSAIQTQKDALSTEITQSANQVGANKTLIDDDKKPYYGLEQFLTDYENSPSIPGMTPQVAFALHQKYKTIQEDESIVNQHEAQLERYYDSTLSEEQKNIMNPEVVIQAAPGPIDLLYSEMDVPEREDVVKAIDMFAEIPGVGDFESRLENMTNQWVRDREKLEKEISGEVTPEEKPYNTMTTGAGVSADPNLFTDGGSIAPISKLIQKMRNDGGYTPEAITGFLDGIASFDNFIFQEDDQDILAKVYDEREEVLGAKERLREKYVTDRELDNVTIAGESKNMIPIYEPTYDAEGIITGAKLNKSKSLLALKNIKEYVTENPGFLADVEMNWDDSEVSLSFDDWIASKKDDNKITNTTDKGVKVGITYSELGYLNPNTNEYEPGYTMHYGFQAVDGQKAYSVQAHAPVSRIHIEGMDELTRGDATTRAGLQYSEFVRHIAKSKLDQYQDLTKQFLGPAYANTVYINNGGSISSRNMKDNKLFSANETKNDLYNLFLNRQVLMGGTFTDQRGITYKGETSRDEDTGEVTRYVQAKTPDGTTHFLRSIFDHIDITE